jgi:hypothetical protein
MEIYWVIDVLLEVSESQIEYYPEKQLKVRDGNNKLFY